MINNLHISSIHAEVTTDIKEYVEKKIGGLEKFVPKRARESVQANIKLKQDKRGYECEVIIALPKATITAHSKSPEALASIDQVEATLRNQLQHYKSTHMVYKMKRRLAARAKVPEVQAS